MTGKLPILHLEDNKHDAELIHEKLAAEGVECDVTLVASREDFVSAIEQGEFDIILADYKLPSFDGISALKLANEKCPEVPFIFISGTIGEDTAVEALKSGATDYIIKDRLSRLAPAVRRALEEAESRRELKRAEEALKESSQLNRQMIECAQEGIIVYDRDLKYQVWNPFMEQLTGVPAGDVLGRHPLEIFPFLREAGVFAAVEKALRGKAVEAARFPFHIPKTGRSGWTSDISAPFRNAQGEIIGVIATVRDVTEHVLAEEALLGAAREWSASFDAMTDGVSIHSPDYTILNVNQSLCRMFRKTAEELIGRKCYEVFHGSVSPAAACPFQGSKDTLRQEYAELFEPVLDKWLAVSTSPIVDDSGKLVRSVHTVRDITERKQKEEELGMLTRILRARNKSSHVMIEAADESWYLNQVCRIIVEDCGHTMVWIGFADDDEDKTVRPVAHAGFEEGYLESLKVTWADTDRGRGPVGTAIRSGNPVIIQDTVADDRFAPWRAEALRRGYASMIGVPLLSGGKAFGSLNIYSGRPNSFTEEEAVLLTDLAADLSYGITAIRTRAAQAEAENKFRDMAEQSMAGIYLVQDGIFKYVNPKLAEIFGYTDRELIDKKGPEYLVFSEDWPIVRDNLRKRISGAIESVHYSFRGIKKNKEIIFVEVYGSKTVYKARPAVIGTLLDITDRKRAEEELLETSQVLQSLIHASPLAIAVLDPNGIVTMWNPAAERIFGWSEQEIVGRFYPAASDEKKDEFRVLRERVLQGESFTGVEVIRERKDGSSVDVNLSTAPLRDFKGDVVGAVGIMADITERKKMEDQIKRSLTEKEILLKEIHHRVKNNLQIISSMLNLQSGYVKDKQALDLFTESRNRVKSMALIHEKLYQSKDLARINFADYVRTLTEDLFRSYVGSSAEIAFKVDIENVFLDIDKAVSCGLIINELITNSLKHAFPSGRKGEITISLHPNINGMLVLTVGDNGKGLPENIDSRNVKSLGLQLVGLLVEQLDGAMEVGRRGGTSFKISFRGILNTEES